MKISIFTTFTNPKERGDIWPESKWNFRELADEVVDVDGGNPASDQTVELLNYEGWRYISSPWPKEFDWKFIGQQFQKGYEAATGDWVIHADMDFIFHEKDYRRIRGTLEENFRTGAVSFLKYQFVQPDRYLIKSRLLLAVNKKALGGRIRFDGGGDLCQPTLDGKPFGKWDYFESKIPFYNYERILKTKEQLHEDLGRFARAWHKHFGNYKLGGPDDESAYEHFVGMVKGRYAKSNHHIGLEDHPKVMQQLIKSLTPDQFGYDGHGLFERNSYVKSS